MEELQAIIEEYITPNSLFKGTISKPKVKADPLKNIYLTPIQGGDSYKIKAVFRFKTNDQTKIFELDDIKSQLMDWLTRDFNNANLSFAEKDITVLQSKKGKMTILKKSASNLIELESHNRSKNRYIDQEESFLSDLGITSSRGQIYREAKDKYVQINRYVEVIEALIDKDDLNELNTVDMGSGKGYLTFGLHHYLNTAGHVPTTKGVEIREDLVEKCNGIANRNNYDHLCFVKGSIEDYQIEKADLVIALHACDIATDMAIAKGLEAEAKYIVVAPCCHKQIRKAITSTETVLSPILNHGILKERLAEMITDTIRALYLESKGYSVKVFEFISLEHTGKNVMITAKFTGQPNPNAINEIEKLKKELGIEYHYLEKLI